MDTHMHPFTKSLVSLLVRYHNDSIPWFWPIAHPTQEHNRPKKKEVLSLPFSLCPFKDRCLKNRIFSSIYLEKDITKELPFMVSLDKKYSPRVLSEPIAKPHKVLSEWKTFCLGWKPSAWRREEKPSILSFKLDSGWHLLEQELNLPYFHFYCMGYQ